MITALLTLFTSFLSLVFGRDEATIVFAGDAMQHQAQLDAAKRGKTYDYISAFSAMAPIVGNADFAVVNLETPVSSLHYGGYPCFNAPHAYAAALDSVGFDLCLTANNHTLDRGAKGLRGTIQTLDSLHLAHTGTYENAKARAKSLPLIRTISGFKIAFLNYTYGTNGIEPRDGVVVDYINKNLIGDDVKKARAAGAELVCVAIHWGEEYKLVPNKSQKLLADYIEALGVDMLIGGHPHVIQPMEFRPNRYYPDKNFALVYSLGNFISAMKTTDTRGGALAHIKLVRDDKHKAIVKSMEYSLVFTEVPAGKEKNYRVVPIDSVGNASKSHAKAFKANALAIFEKYNINVGAYKY